MTGAAGLLSGTNMAMTSLFVNRMALLTVKRGHCAGFLFPRQLLRFIGAALCRTATAKGRVGFAAIGTGHRDRTGYFRWGLAAFAELRAGKIIFKARRERARLRKLVALCLCLLRACVCKITPEVADVLEQAPPFLPKIDRHLYIPGW